MENSEKLKEIVREKYGKIAEAVEGSADSSCCATSCCGGAESESPVDFSEDYSRLKGYVAEADLGLGCGIPTDSADLQPGQTVLDLGSGAGNDVFVARGSIGDSGFVIGVDMTAAMVKKARENQERLGYSNVDFRLGEIENLPVESASVDRVISNCVLNLVPDKARAFCEIHRTLKPGGSFSVSDVVLNGKLPEGLQKAAELYVGCVSGALQKEEYLARIREAGFSDIEVTQEKRLRLPVELAAQFLNPEEMQLFRESDVGILSITVRGRK